MKSILLLTPAVMYLYCVWAKYVKQLIYNILIICINDEFTIFIVIYNLDNIGITYFMNLYFLVFLIIINIKLIINFNINMGDMGH